MSHPGRKTSSTPAPAPAPASVWWELRAFGAGSHPAGTRYGHDNRQRPRTGSWVVELVQEGGIRFELENAPAVEVRPGGLFLFAYGEPSWYGRHGPLPGVHRSRWVTLRGAGLAEHLTLLRTEHAIALAEPDPADPAGAAVSAAMDRLLAACPAPPEERPEPADAATEVFRFVAAVAAAAERRGLPGQRPVDRALRQLLGRPHHAWSMKEVAAAHGVSREHLARAFTARVGEPPHRHLRRLRVRRALELLRCTELPLHEVARQSGFATAQTLRRQVQRETGQTPSDLRAGG